MNLKNERVKAFLIMFTYALSVNFGYELNKIVSCLIA